MRKLSLQWRITLMTALLIGVTCGHEFAAVLLRCVLYGHHCGQLQGGGTVILNEEGTVSFDPQLIAPNEELTIVVDGAQGRFRTTNWYITAAVTLLGGILAYFVSGRALRPLRSFVAQVEQVQPNNLADMKITEEVLPEFRQFSASFNEMLDRLDEGFSAQRQFTGNAAHELRTPLALMQAQLELFSAEHPDARPETADLIRLLREQTERMTQMTKTLLEMSELRSVPCTDRIELGPMAEEILTDLAPLAEKKGRSPCLRRRRRDDRQRHAHLPAAVQSDRECHSLQPPERDGAHLHSGRGNADRCPRCGQRMRHTGGIPPQHLPALLPGR